MNKRSIALVMLALNCLPESLAQAEPRPTPCELVAHGNIFEITASGTCRCADGRCETVTCSATASAAAEVEIVKQRLRFELSAMAQSMNGRLDQASISFSVRSRFQ